MADKPNETPIGGRLNLVDPNNFNNLYGGGIFGDSKYNMSVPLEDLSVTVELKTSTKNRTILTTESNTNTAITTGGNGNVVRVDFITGKNDKTTGNENYLTTNYTNLSTELNDIDETLGITNIEIDFNSSYAPMINIQFVDVKGGSIFQNNGTSKYNVFFKLPYPIFELTIKGYYGKPVTYCLHLVKCNTKFNSQTGNFEISAQFVGYTYAMLSDMLVGYLKAAGITKAGQQKLADRGVKSIKDFLFDVADIDKISKDLLSSDDEDVKNLTMLNTLRESIRAMAGQIKSVVLYGLSNDTPSQDTNTNILGSAGNNVGSGLGSDTKYTNYGAAKTIVNGVSLDETIAIIKDPNPQSNTFDDSKNKAINDDFNNKFLKSVDEFNKLVINQSDIQIDNTDLTPSGIITKKQILEQQDSNIEEIKEGYGVQDVNVINNIRARLNAASINITDNGYIKFYDFTDLMIILNSKLAQIDELQNDLSKIIGLKLQEKITAALGFSSSIRNIINIFTTHVEVFLEQLFDVSAKAYKDESGDRIAQLKKWKNKLDIHKNSAVIYPWPEYNENNIEKYLGTNGVLEIPQNVPEIAFVEELYQAMIKFDKIEVDVNKLLTEGKNSWYGFNPVDSQFFNTNENNPYQRLGGNPSFDDVARFITLRAIGFIGFSNHGLTTDEIETFANQESQLLLKQFNVAESNIIKLLNQKYTSADIYANVKGTVDSKEINVLVSDNDKWKYNYIVSDTKQKLLPVSTPFNVLDSDNLTNTTILTNNETNRATSTQPNGVSYISFIDSSEYSRNTLTPLNPTTSIFSLDKLFNDLTKPSDFTDAGFIANAGRYGVQEFIKINHNSTNGDIEPIGEAPFYTLFYNAGNVLFGKTKSSSLQTNNGLLSPSLCRPRSASPNVVTTWDLKTSVTQLPRSGDKSLGAHPSISELYDKYSFGKISTIYSSRADIGRNLYLLNQSLDTISYPFVTFGVYSEMERGTNSSLNVEMSLFGSRFYNEQNLQSRAFLFLHSLPWRGLLDEVSDRKGLFTPNEIINIFQHRTGFIQIPKLYSAFIGGLLWRFNEGETNSQDPIIWTVNGEDLIPKLEIGGNPSTLPTTREYLKTVGGSVQNQASAMCFKNGNSDYVHLDTILITLPEKVKKQFVDEFTNFVDEFDRVRSNFEIGNSTTWVADWNYLNTKVTEQKNNEGITVYNIPTNELTTRLKLSDRFNVVSFIPKNDGDGNNDIGNKFKYNYFLEFKDDSTAVQTLKTFISSYKYISNNTWVMWNKQRKESSSGLLLDDKDIVCYKTEFETYIKAMMKPVSDTVSEDEKQKFTNNNSNEIKLEIYRTLKKIYDKWIAFSDKPEKILFQCCKTEGDRLGTDKARKIHRLKQNNPNASDGSNPALIDSFRFVTRSFRDVGDEFQINPVIISQLLLQSTNISFYDLVSRVLTDNNFDFIALPSFVDYNNPDEIKSIFTPYPYYQAAKLAKSGPSFVCVYVGQTSSKLDFGSSSDHPNDGFDLTDSTTLPSDFKGDKKEWEDVGAAFVVKYGQQNQNLFKDISLDQAEFSETAESLQITDNIANKFSQTNQSYMGQNLYNVYSVRSYRVEVEMLGDAMIQPMMYFQLDNIPMFHGAYLITKVKHTLKPNYMSTLFSGVRIKANETPLIEAAVLYSSLLQGYELNEVKQGSILTTGTNLSVMKNTKTGAIPTKSASYSSAGLSVTEAANNQLLVKNFLKKNNVSKVVAAGIMGNIKKESGFDPKASADDINGRIALGLIQWNAKSYNLASVGTTIDSQMNFLFSNTDGVSSFLSKNATATDPFETAFQFAKLVERCANCLKYEQYLSDSKYKPYERGQYANDFYSRFNLIDDLLYW